MNAEQAIKHIPLKKQMIDVRINRIDDPLPARWHRAAVIRAIQGADLIRPTPACAPVPSRFGLAVDSCGETLFIEARL